MTKYTGTVSSGAWVNFYMDVTLKSQSASSNSSTVHYKLYLVGKSGYGFYDAYHTGTVEIYANGGNHIVNKTGVDFDTRGGKTQVLEEGDYTVKHDSTGQGKFDFSGFFNAKTIGYSGKVTGSYKLPPLASSATFTLSPSRVQPGETVTISINGSSGQTYTARFGMWSEETIIATKTSNTSITWTVPSDWSEKYLKNMNETWGTLYVDTYQGSSKIGTQSERLDIYIPEGNAPVISGLQTTEANSKKSSIIGSTPYYQKISDIKATAAISTDPGAQLASVTMEMDGERYTGNPVTFTQVSESGQRTIKVTATDTRGRTATKSYTVNVEPYELPSVLSADAFRDSSNQGIGRASIKAKHTVMGTTDKNGMSVTVSIAESGSSSYSQVYKATSNIENYSQTVTVGTTLDPYKSYSVKVEVADKFFNNTAVATLSTATMTMVLGADKPAVGIGKVPEVDAGLDVKGKLVLNGKEIADIPKLTQGSDYFQTDGGLLICWGSIYLEYNQKWNLKGSWQYPKLFKENPKVLVTVTSFKNAAGSNDDRYGQAYSNNIHTGNCDVLYWSPKDIYTQGDRVAVDILAIGRWK